ncbi:hypothetical protein RvY_05203-4 [Ramazzottius varieornatus]|uniref:Uncharacterized protein n=1 Tax=Ramazzottius varieornatus TaxID=947166 RepID=A0A1D1UXV6_RAMVA|nr:hypothetical protein RvY_05203-4 [Ramazzottius varieornatus]
MGYGQLPEGNFCDLSNSGIGTFFARWSAKKKQDHGSGVLKSLGLLFKEVHQCPPSKSSGKKNARGVVDRDNLRKCVDLSPAGEKEFLKLCGREALNHLHEAEKTTKQPEKSADTKKPEGAKKAGGTKKKSSEDKSKSRSLAKKTATTTEETIEVLKQKLAKRNGSLPSIVRSVT